MTSLPESVRQRVIALAADVLGGLAPDETPPPLKAVAKFTAPKRAKLGGTAIAAALESDAEFRGRVLEAARSAHPGLVEAVSAGQPPPAADPADVATVAFLLRPDGWTDLVAAAGDSARRTGTRPGPPVMPPRSFGCASSCRPCGPRRGDPRAVEGRDRAAQGRERGAATAPERGTDTGRGERGCWARGDGGVGARRERGRIGPGRREAEARRLRARLAEVEQALEGTRRAGREGRSLETARLGLLLDTLAEAAAGLRRELALPASTVRPADTVDALEPAPVWAGGRPGDDPAALDDLLSLPQAHLIVDGYNVTKSAWPTMPLEAQRNRLVQGLAALAARTGAEVTCVFDGADVGAPRFRSARVYGFASAHTDRRPTS